MQPRSFSRGLRRACRIVVACLATAATLAHAASNVVEYTYDAAGNITNMVRQPSPGFAITSFDPTSGAVGATVTIYGTGFSATPANNAVKFNGVTATVSASESGSISTTVPSGATTGRITVTVSGNTATGATDFVVTVPGAPTITSFSPSSGVAGASITVTGTNFDPAASATTVKLNGVTATSSVSSTTNLSFSVPGATASGRIAATTAGGTGTSVSDFLVPPPGVSASEIASLLRVSADGPSAALAIGTANTRGLVLFDGAADTYYSIQLGQLAVTPSNAFVPYSVIKPDNTVLTTGSVALASDTSRPTIHLPKLPVAGTYSLLVSPGIATVNSNVRVVTDPVISIDGSSASFALDTASESGRVVFNASAGQRIGLGVGSFTLTPSNTSVVSYFSAYNPDGSQLGSSVGCNSAGGSNPQGNCDGEFLTNAAGLHTVVGRPYVGYSGSFSMQVSSEVTGTLTAGTGADITLARVGQDARYTFTAGSGDSLAFALSGITPLPQAQSFSATIYKPDGSQFLQTSATPPNGAYLEMGTIATAGAYTVFLDPSLGAYGSLRMTLMQGALLGTADSPASFAPSTTSEAVRYRFSGTTGQNLAVGIENLANVGGGSASSTLNVYAPDRTNLASVSCTPGVAGGRCKATLTNLPSTGTYSIAIVPPAGVKITGAASVSADLTGTLVAGTPQSITASRDGQNARYTFSGTAGDSTSVKFYGVSTNPTSQTMNVKVYKPDGTLLTSGSAISPASIAVNLGSLPTTGTYTVLIEPFYGTTWAGTLALDSGVLLTVDGTMQTLTNSAAGEPIRFRFSGTSGQRMEWGLSGLTYASASSNTTTMSIYQPSGSLLTNQSCGTAGAGSCELSSTSLPATGTYSAIFVPPAASSITGGTFAASTPLSGTFVVADPSQTVAITRPGQTARYTFSGTSGQLLRLNWTSVTVSGGATVSVSVLKPDNSTLTTSSFANGASSGVDIASLPSTGTYTIVLDPSSAATLSASMSLVTR